MTDNDNTHNRTRPYQRQQPEVPEVDEKLAEFMFWEGWCVALTTNPYPSVDDAIRNAIADWKAQQAEKE